MCEQNFKKKYFDLLDRLAEWGLNPELPRPSRQFVMRWFDEYQYEQFQAQEREREQARTRLYLEKPYPPKQYDIKEEAQNAVNGEVAAGRLPRIKTRGCQDCGMTAGVYHHESYDQAEWLNVVPLCHKCHSKRHHKKPNAI